MTSSAAKRANRNARVDERFEQWYAETLAWRPMAFAEHSENDLRRGFVGGIEYERTHALDVIRRVEALPVEIQTNHPGAPPPHFTRKLVSLAAVMDLLEELRR